MVQRTKRAASLPPAPTEAHRLKLESGRRALAEWELDVPMVPAPVLAEAWRGGAGRASLSLFLRMCQTEALTEELAREVGALARQADHDDVVDVSVVEGAIRRGDAIVTSNSIRARKIVEAAGADLNVEFI